MSDFFEAHHKYVHEEQTNIAKNEKFMVTNHDEPVPDNTNPDDTNPDDANPDVK